MEIPYKRILLKLSGEILIGSEPFGINGSALKSLCESIKTIVNAGHELAIVIGGGNILRGANLNGVIARTPADHMGMLGTLINGIAIQQECESLGIDARLMSAIECPKIAENYNWRQADLYLDSGRLLIFVGGTGNPYFTTDTAAALRASEINATILLKATKVAGVFTEDPIKNPKAVKYPSLSYSQYLAEKLKVMDATSVALCMENKIPIFVFSMKDLGKVSIGSLLTKPETYGTMIH